MNLMYIVSRLIFHFITDQYILSLFVIGFGSGFYPIGLRVGYTLGKRLSNIYTFSTQDTFVVCHLVAEYTNEKGRLHLYLSGWIFWVFGGATLALIAWLTADWFVYGMVTTLLNCLIIPFWWYVCDKSNGLCGSSNLILPGSLRSHQDCSSRKGRSTRQSKSSEK